MGWKNEMLDKKECMQLAVDSGDVETVAEIVNEWRTEGWTYPEIYERIHSWTGLELKDIDGWEYFDGLM